MQYCDIDLDGNGTNDYRGVKFSKYRPYYTTMSAYGNADYSYQDNNGYEPDTEYYFAYEPLTWKVLDSASGLVMCENIIDSQAYNDYVYGYKYADKAYTVYANNWENSSVRSWLNGTFCNTAFSAGEIEYIKLSSLSNDGYTGEYGYGETDDSIFLLSYEDLTSVSSATAQGSDYAQAQGLYADEENNSYWRLRTAGSDANLVCSVKDDGSIETISNVSDVYYGIRPAFFFNMKVYNNPEDWDSVCNWSADFSTATVTFTKKNGRDTKTLDATVTSKVKTAATCTAQGTTTYTATVTFLDTSFIYTKDVQNIAAIAHSWDDGVITTAANCVDTGVKTYTCSVCKGTKTEVIPVDSTNHKTVVTDEEVPATCRETGLTEGSHCSACNTVIKAQATINTVSHTVKKMPAVAPTCTEEGNTEWEICAVCGETLDSPGYIEPLGHKDADGDYICDVCNESVFENGSTFAFGTYPQSKVTDETVTDALTALLADDGWVSYGFWYGDDNYGTMKQGDYWKYQDVTLDGQKYRAVYFTEYRPCNTRYDLDEDNSYQSDNGYYTNTVYFFKFEPVYWIVLDAENGVVITDKLIYATAYCSYITDDDLDCYNSKGTYANNYVDSDIREWLNNDFYNTAFTAEDKAVIQKTECDNSSYYSYCKDFSYETTNDNIFLLSTHEAYAYFEDFDSNETGVNTDYAMCLGAFADDDNAFSNDWWLRDSSDSSDYVRIDDCWYGFDEGHVGYASTGVRPAVTLDFSALTGDETWDEGVCSWAENGKTATVTFTSSENNTETLDAAVTGEVKTAATCTANGTTTYTAKVTFNGTEYTFTKDVQDIDTVAHSYAAVTVAPTCTAKGYTVHTCTVCSDTFIDSYVNAPGHSFTSYTYNNDATCTSDGTKTAKCDRCDATETVTAAGTALGHTDAGNDGVCDRCGANIGGASGEETGDSSCSHLCHSDSAFVKFFWKIFNFFNKLFKINQYCKCGAQHW